MKAYTRHLSSRGRNRPMIRQAVCVLGLAVGLVVTQPAAATLPPAGRVVAWGCGGTGNYGQCVVPTSVSNGVTAIAGGLGHSLALKRDGSVVAWGCSTFVNAGQCAVPTAAASGVVAIGAGDFHSLAQRGSSVIAWGCGGGTNHGQCAVPVEATNGVALAAAGPYHNLALKQDGHLIAWGCGGTTDYGQCAVPGAAASGVVAISAGRYHSLALKQDGSVIAWGCGGFSNHGQCNVPVAATSGVIAIAAGWFHSLALKKNGSVVVWGCGPGVDWGQCAVPAAAGSGVTTIAAGAYNSLAIRNGSVIAWGCATGGNYGQCTFPDLALAGIFAVGAGAYHGLALDQLSDQTITVTAHAPATATYKESFTVLALSSAPLPVTYTSGGACTNVGTKFTMTSATGTCLVKYDQSGNDAYNPAQQVVESVAAQQAEQTIKFAPLAAKTYDDPDFTVAASASSGLAVSFAASGSCAVSGATVHLTGAGSCTVTAGQPGDANYQAAASVERSLSVAKADQTIAFAAIADKTYGDADFSVGATSSSGLPVSFVATGSCLISGASVHLTGAGSCQLAALQLGDSNYNPAPPVPRIFSIARATQTITFGALAQRTYGDPDFAVSASASSGLAVSFSASGSCTVTGVTVHLTGSGPCTVTASQAGDANYTAAADVAQTFSIAAIPLRPAATCVVPKVVGKRLSAAKLALARKHCRVGKVKYAYSRNAGKGTVASQSRRPGTVVAANSRVDLVLSRGRRP
jgi:hypothetical protein